MEEHLRVLAEHPEPDERERRMEALVACPHPLAPPLRRVVGGAGPLVEAMTRRYYRIRDLESVGQRLVENVPFVLTSYAQDGVGRSVAATLGDADDLPRALHALGAHGRRLRDDEERLAHL